MKKWSWSFPLLHLRRVSDLYLLLPCEHKPAVFFFTLLFSLYPALNITGTSVVVIWLHPLGKKAEGPCMDISRGFAINGISGHSRRVSRFTQIAWCIAVYGEHAFGVIKCFSAAVPQVAIWGKITACHISTLVFSTSNQSIVVIYRVCSSGLMGSDTTASL